MTELILVRHGKSNYSNSDRLGLKGHGHDLAPLTDEGVKSIEDLSKQDYFKKAEVIVVSPYTRTMQTAMIINKKLGLDIIVDIDLREWEPDLTYQYEDIKVVQSNYNEFLANNGIYPEGVTPPNWESMISLKNRVKQAIDRYKKYNCIIVVTHKMIIKTITEKDVNCGEYISFKI